MPKPDEIDRESRRPWLPEDFISPGRLEITHGYHARPIRASDVDIDYSAVMTSRERLWELYGSASGWPRKAMTKAEDELDLHRHAHEMSRNVSFNYAVLNSSEELLAGCIYVDPASSPDYDADVSWWVIDALVGRPLNLAMRTVIPTWITQAWPFTRPHFDPRSR